MINNKKYEILPGSLFFISPGQAHIFKQGIRMQGGRILFTADFFLSNQPNMDKLFEVSFLDNIYAEPLVKLSCSDYQSVKQTINLLCHEKEKKNYSEEIVQSFLHILVAQVQRSIDEQTGRQCQKKELIIYKRFKSLLDIHAEESRSIGYYAYLLKLSQRQLIQNIRLVTGKSINEVIKDLSVQKSKRITSTSAGSSRKILN